jgi:phage gpG-like protein
MADVSNLRIDSGILAFDFAPSIGILARDIDKMGVDIRSFREPLRRAIKEVMIPSFKKNFQQGGRPDPWEPLADATLQIRQRLHGRSGGAILIRTGNLMRNMGYTTMWNISSESASIQQLPDRVWYGAIHQGGFGTMKSRTAAVVKAAAKQGKRLSPGDAARAVNASIDAQIRRAMQTGTKVKTAPMIPARPFVLIQDEDEDNIVRVFEDWMDERLARAGFS